MGKYSVLTTLVLLALVGCNKPQTQTAQTSETQGAPPESANVTSGDASNGNLAPVTYSSEPQAPPPDQSTSANYSDYYGQAEAQAPEPPPPLPDYDQPPAPGDDYIWTPGYWNYASSGYYWVPGAWVLAPYVGALWTPPWWGYANGDYVLHAGYWAPHIGYYGGVDYGWGYNGRGYYGGYWNHGQFAYNRAVTNVDSTAIHNVYDYRVPNNRGPRVSYNGGRGGVNVRPTPQELAVAREQRTAPVAAQMQHAREAAGNRSQFIARGAAKPSVLVAPRPLATAYKAPAPPPARIARAEQPPAPGAGRPPAPEANRGPETRPANQPEGRAAMPPHPVAQGGREVPPATTPRPSPPPARPEAIPTAPPRPAPVQARPEARPTPQAEPQRQQRAIPQARPEPVPTAPARPAPAARPNIRQVEPQRPAPEARPAPASRPSPEARPAPAPRQIPEARPAAPPRPAPQARPAPAPRPEPAARPPQPQKEERK